MKKDRKIGIYVHIPFCIQKCKYCDFLSSSYNNNDIGQREKALAYINALEKEIILYGYKAKEYKVSSIYIGGGTPSVIDTDLIGRIVRCINLNYHVEKDVEITMEANPATLLNKKLQDYKLIGINRISLGMQSTSNSELTKLGRVHSYEEFLENYYRLRECGFNNINIDVMSAIPNQSIGSYLETLEKVVKLNPEHISSYSLIIEEGTYFYKNKDKLNLVCEEDEREMYHLTKKVLQENGYNRYEISNYAKKGMESRHNSSYWTGQYYLGFGVGASSYFNETRFDRVRDIDKYIKFYNTISIDSLVENSKNMQDILESCHKNIQKNIEYNIEHLSTKDKMEEFMFLGLRLIQGVSKKEFSRRFNKDINDVYGKVIDKYVNMKLMESDGDRVCLTDSGLDVSNVIFADMLL